MGKILMQGPSVLVLMYHQIIPDGMKEGWVPSPLADPSYGITLSEFRRQMEVLREHRIPTLSLSEWMDATTSERIPFFERPCVIVTFDDGYGSDYDLAAPVLKDFEIPATFFVSTDLLGSPGMLNNEKLLSLIQNPLFDLGSHGATHRFLSSLSEKECRRELEKSFLRIREAKVLAGRIFTEPIDLSAPGGRTNRKVANFARETGFRALMTSAPGILRSGENLFSIPRLPVMNHHSREDFISLLDPSSFAFQINTLARSGRRLAGGFLDWIRSSKGISA